MRTLFLLFLILFSLNAYSQEEFKLIGRTKIDGGNKVYVRLEDSQPNQFSIWLKIEIFEPQKNNKVQGGYSMAYMIFYCSEKVYDIQDYIVYDKNGKVFESGNKLTYHERIVPQSLIEGVYNYVVGYRKSKN